VTSSRDRHSTKTSITSVTSVESGPGSASKRRGEACLVVIYGPELGKRATLGRSTFQIGRSSKNDLPIDQESVSRHHARIIPVTRAFFVEDMGSTNGTFVNDELVAERRPLKDGDQIKIGRSILKFMSGTNIEANYHEEIYRLMTVDALTQTYNRRYFNEALEREYNRSSRYKGALSLCLFDLDHFKKINDAHGHLAGDAVLRTVAAEVKPRLRQQDIFARVGGEEFAALLPEVGREGAVATAEKIRRIIAAAPIAFEGTPIPVTVSVGVAILSDVHKNETELYKTADDALYAAKNGGRNRVEVR
jgi:two-component system cell cycle response regulator